MQINSKTENITLFEALYDDLPVSQIKKILKKNKSEINKKNIYNQYPLNYALENLKNPLLIETLLKNKANPNKKNNNKIFSLDIALRKKWDFHIIELLIKNKLKITYKKDCKYNILMMALKYKSDFDTIKLLVDSGCNVNWKNKYNESVLKYSLLYNYSDEVIIYLLKKIDDVKSSFFLLILYEKKYLVRYLFEKSIYFNKRVRLTFLHLHYIFLETDYLENEEEDLKNFNFNDIEYLNEIGLYKKCVFGWNGLQYKFWAEKKNSLSYYLAQ